ncbi:ependymin-2-like [Gadus macrocephalus]|uniref:ependymin-2-like n=1 Tax=Gadus macrocephalus TaxID=80720 RepID=UPI0028CBBCA0|nr:ependymin-2-like [Gadus macrocephalus]
MNVLGPLSFLSLVLVLSAPGTSAQKPKPCEVPGLMSGDFTLMNDNQFFMSTGKMNYDAFNQRMSLSSFDFNSTVSGMIMLFQEKVYYEISWDEGTCKKRPLDATFNPVQVPAGAQLMAQLFMGSSSSWGMGVLVNTWFGLLPQGMYTHVFTEVGCIPISFTIANQEGWTTLSTFNWVIGSAQPMDFVPPAFCDAAQLEVSEKPDTFLTAVKSLTKPTKAKN